MKKTIITSMALASLAAGVLLYSCKKQETILPQKTITSLPQANDVNVSVKNDLLVFKSKQDYRTITDNPSSEQKVKFVDNVKSMNSFSSYYKYFSANKTSVLSDTSAIDNDFLQTILNKDAAVQIGGYIYKIDMKKEKVFALDTTHADQYSDVVSGNTANSNVRAFSIGDDVLSLTGNDGALEKGNGLMKYEDDGGGGGSGGGGSGPCDGCTIGTNKSEYTTAGYDFTLGNSAEERIIDGKIKYERYGIYYTLYSRMDANADNTTNTQTQYLLDVYVYYHVHNGVTNGPYTVTDYTNGNTIAALKYQSYDGSKPIAWMNFKSRYKIKVLDPTVTATFPPTSWLEFYFNM